MPSIKSGKRLYDARPDRVDYRDREYQPPLVSLEKEIPPRKFAQAHIDDYVDAGLILDQGSEGACTGFGLGAVVNYLLWIRAIEGRNNKERAALDHDRVSPNMLYHLAKVYDEWPGESYEGSSCRGAMKGWHKHGVCLDSLWAKPWARGRRSKTAGPRTGWAVDAAQRPLGAYYRVNRESILDMQAAIQEVGAVYASADVHEGWNDPGRDKLSVMEMGEVQGGHAFAIVGYNESGFIVQNSWGVEWGYRGFAIMSYVDWLANSMDAWVAVLGAPMKIQEASRTMSRRSSKHAQAARLSRVQNDEVTASEGNVLPRLSEEQAYLRTVVLGNDGIPENRFVDLPTAQAAVEEVCLRLTLQRLKDKRSRKIAIYAHGGLNDEEASIDRIRVMAPYFEANRIVPIFLTWKTGARESIENILSDKANALLFGIGGDRAEGLWDWGKEKLEAIKKKSIEAKDRTVEVAAERLLVKAIWSQMKQNAAAASRSHAGLGQLARSLKKLRRQFEAEQNKKLEIHLIGHSAGSIVLGHLLQGMKSQSLSASSASLFAPACTVEFALDKYGKAFKQRTLARRDFHVSLLSEARERADSVGPYAKSLLYLVSRALEDVHKMPILGLETAWEKNDPDQDLYHHSQEDVLRDWRKLIRSGNPPHVVSEDRRLITEAGGTIATAHGSFDNDIEVMTATIKRVRGSALLQPIGSLRGF